MFALEELHSFRPIQTGIENSNYIVSVDDDGQGHEYVLTILEHLSLDDVPFFNTLMTHLADQGLPVPAPRATLDGMTSTIFCGKPALLFPKLPGSHPEKADASACCKVGRALAEMHRAAATLALPPGKIRKNPYDPAWAGSTLTRVAPALPEADRRLLDDYVACYEIIARDSELPKGIIHGDLFRDNTLFVDGELTGIIDFYHACEDYLIQDLAITLNDWCSRETGEIDKTLATKMIAGYESVRTLTQRERDMLPEFRKAGAMRFILTRLISGKEDGHLKDPEEFLKIARRLDPQQ